MFQHIAKFSSSKPHKREGNMKGDFHSTKAAFFTLGRFLMLTAYLYAERTISSQILGSACSL